jgi:SH3-like domain-containing protein
LLIVPLAFVSIESVEERDGVRVMEEEMGVPVAVMDEEEDWRKIHCTACD